MIRISDDGAVRTIILDRPEVRNALNLEMLRALRAALRAADTAAVRCLVLTGSGKAFCAGADIAEWADAEARGELATYPWTDEMHALIAELAAFPKPSLVLLNGAAAGAGLDLALACDFRFAAETARFVCAYTRMGYNPDAGGTWFLPRLIGLEAAKRFAFTGEFWSASEALARGLVTEVHAAEALEPAGRSFAAQLAAGPTVALMQTKRLMAEAGNRGLPDQLAEERRAADICGASADAKEALAAAVERREPNFKGH
ncbi:enoyl-CoA hydratase/isomerase family protein [Virgifigura deserti]|uniref:enoyl-CoA hydratase/isomerase family protein n=1 Tax=Virgifigura deserti TaxID=2268457 RepID=UPI003CCC2E9D